VLTAFRLVMGLVGAVPVLVFWHGDFARACLAAVVAVAVVLIAGGVRPGEGAHLARVFRPVAVVAVLPALWMVIQILPLPISGLLHPIWVSAREALHGSWGSISIDTGATLLALTRYLTFVGIAVATAAVAIDRERAERLLLVAAAVATLVAVLLALHGLGALFFFGSFDDAAAASALEGIAALGVLATSAAAVRAFERHETRHAPTSPSLVGVPRSVLPWLAGLVICWAALLLFAHGPVTFAAACGFASIAWAVIVRRVGLGLWTGGALAVLAIGAAVLIAANQPGQADHGLPLRFAASASAPLISLTQRLLAETPWAGSGAGTFAALVPIYRGGEEVVASALAPTTAADFGIALSPPRPRCSRLSARQHRDRRRPLAPRPFSTCCNCGSQSAMARSATGSSAVSGRGPASPSRESCCGPACCCARDQRGRLDQLSSPAAWCERRRIRSPAVRG
jgi:hypothetical protein